MKQHPFSYEIIYSSRKTLALQVTAEGKVLVRSPRRLSAATIDRFLTEKEDWVLKQLKKFSSRPTGEQKLLSDTDRRRYISIARDIFAQKTAYYASILHVTYNRISIREQKTRWGSCSSAGNLNFNWRLIFAPEEVVDYIVVHELAHRREMNHSKAFYDIVASVLPNYKASQKWLRKHGDTLWINP